MLISFVVVECQLGAATRDPRVGFSLAWVVRADDKLVAGT